MHKNNNIFHQCLKDNKIPYIDLLDETSANKYLSIMNSIQDLAQKPIPMSEMKPRQIALMATFRSMSIEAKKFRSKSKTSMKVFAEKEQIILEAFTALTDGINKIKPVVDTKQTILNGALVKNDTKTIKELHDSYRDDYAQDVNAVVSIKVLLPLLTKVISLMEEKQNAQEKGNTGRKTIFIGDKGNS